MIHNYNLGYIVFEKIGNYSVRLFPHNGNMIDYENKISYQMHVEQTEKLKEILFEDIAIRPTGLTSFSIGIQYQHVHLAYDFTSPDCSPTNYDYVLKDHSIKRFLLTQNLEALHVLVRKINKMR